MDLQRHIEEWTKANEPLGIELGYPKCCIHEFCQQPPALLNHTKPDKNDIRRYKAGCVDGHFTGFIPCSFHAKQITTGKITLDSLIANRNSEFPKFPNL